MSYQVWGVYYTTYIIQRILYNLCYLGERYNLSTHILSNNNLSLAINPPNPPNVTPNTTYQVWGVYYTSY